jgi:uncharacterized membrane protein YcaP (DUF421 family)
METLVNSSPTILFYEGQFLKNEMEKEKVTEEEVFAEIRKYRLELLSEVRAVILEVNGTFSVIKKSSISSLSEPHVIPQEGK